MGTIVTWTDEKKIEAFNEIIAWICSGKSVRSILLDKTKNMPCAATFYGWLIDDDRLANNYTRAMSIKSDVLVDELIDIADDSSEDTKVAYDKSGNEILIEDKEWVNRTRLRLDTRKWIAARQNPKKYGDKVEHDVQVTDKVIKFKFGEPIPVDDIEDVKEIE